MSERDGGSMLVRWKFTCPFCGEIFTSDIATRVENDYTMHHMDKHPEKSIWDVDRTPERYEV